MYEYIYKYIYIDMYMFVRHFLSPPSEEFLQDLYSDWSVSTTQMGNVTFESVQATKPETIV